MASLDLRRMVGSTRGLMAAFEHPNFRLLWLGRFSSNTGRMMRVFLRGWVVWQLTGSPLLMGVVISSLSWPMMFMPFLGGIMADKMDRRRLLIITESLLVVLWAAVSLLLTLDLIQWWHFIVSSVISGVIQSFGRPSHFALVADVVAKKHLPNAVALDTAAQSWPAAAAPALGVLLIPFIGVAGGFWITTLAQLLTVATILKLDWAPQERPTEQGSVGDSFLEGFKHVRGEPVLLGLVALGICSAIFAHSYNFLLPVFASDILGLGGEIRGVQGLGVLMTSSAIGASVGSVVVVALSNLQRRGILLLGAVLLSSLLIIAFSRSEVFVLSLVLLFFMRIMGMVSQTINTTAMQLLAPDHLRGRVMSLRIVLMGFSPIGVLLMGALAEPTLLGVPNTVLVGGMVYGVVAMTIFALMPALRRFR